MSILRALLLLVSISLAVSARAQISQAADYFGKIGSADFHVTVNGSGNAVDFHYYSNGREEGSGTIVAGGNASFTTNRNRIVSLRVQGGSVTGTLAGQAFSATKESNLGPLASISGLYSGSLIEFGPTGSLLATFLTFMKVYPSGKTTLEFANALQNGSGFNVQYGVGTMAPSGVVTFTIASSIAANNGDSLRMTFTLEDDIAVGYPTSGFFPRNSYTYMLTRAKAATVINVSTRGMITPNGPMTAGFVVSGGPKTVLIRVTGPTLGLFGVPGANADPRVTLYSGATVIGSNDNWGENANASEITSAATQVGAFALANGSRDAALLVHLQPGAYTAQAASVGAAAGDSLVEVYEVTK